MRLKHTLRIINWSAAAIVVAVLIWGKEKDYAWIAIVILAAVFLHFLLESVLMLTRGRFRRRLADLNEFNEHRPFQVKDLEAALSTDAMMEGVTVPVILTGTVTGSPEKKAPLCSRNAIAYRVVAEPLEGLAKVGAQVVLVDSHWGEMSLRDETGSIRITGPGVLDGSSLRERVFTLKNLKEELPGVASRVEDGLGIHEGKDRVVLHEIALFPSDKVLVYGKAERSSGRMTVSGNETIDSPNSLLVRAAASPASSKIPRRVVKTIVFSTITVGLFAGLIALVSGTVISGLFKPGGILDPTKTGPVSLDLDGRPLRITIGSAHWSLEKGDTTRGFSLSSDQSSFQASRASLITIESVEGVSRTIQNGDLDYPRWDGADWVFEEGTAGQVRAQGAVAHNGRLYVRNLTSSAVRLRILDARGNPMADTTWRFDPHEGAGDPRGSYLLVEGQGPLLVPSDRRVETITEKGSHRILPVVEVARWRETGSWLFEIVPEYLAGEGKLYVKNRSDAPLRIWILGADGKPLFGEEPWTFEPQEGIKEDKGMRLQYEGKDITISGREAIKVETQRLTPLYAGTLERIGRWRKGSWTIDLGSAGR